MPITQAIFRAMQTDLRFPEQAANQMAATLNWNQGLQGILEGVPWEGMEIVPDPECVGIPLEWLPSQLAQGRHASWLDRELPLYRLFAEGGVGGIFRHRDTSLAILHAVDAPLFRDIAAGLREKLDARFQGKINRFSGDLYDAGTAEGRERLYQDVFLRHRAVLFIGHTTRDEKGEIAAWRLSDRQTLDLAELARIFQAHSENRHLRSAPPLPELVFAFSCSSAVVGIQQPDAAGESGHLGGEFARKLFRSGIRDFIGTTQDLWVQGREIGELRNSAETFLMAFFEEWLHSPGDTFRHLFKAKHEAGFPLWVSLFQLYTNRPPEATGRISGASIVGGLREVGFGAGPADITEEGASRPCKLLACLWEDTHSIGIHATMGESEGDFLLQVPKDAWQARPGFSAALDKAVRQLARLGLLGVGHLLPTARVDLHLGPAGARTRLDALKFPIPRGFHGGGYALLVPGQKQLKPAEVLELALGMARRLAEMHSLKALHGNVEGSSFLIPSGGGTVWLKDAWLRLIEKNPCTGVWHAAPAEIPYPDQAEHLKYDCWGLGMTLAELACEKELPRRWQGEPGWEAVCAVLPTLESQPTQGIIKRLLVPRPARRTSPEVVSLLSAAGRSGYSSHPKQSRLLEEMQAGYRLFAIWADNMDELAEDLAKMAKHQGRPFLALARPDADFTSLLGPWNANKAPVFLLRGLGWWDRGPVIHRAFRNCRQHPETHPVVVIADPNGPALIDALPAEMLRLFQFHGLAQLDAQALSEKISGYCRQRNLPMDGFQAYRLAEQLAPATGQEVEGALRLGWLTHGALDGRVSRFVDGLREQQFRSLGSAAYIAWERLADPASLSFPTSLEEKLLVWVEGVRELDQVGSAIKPVKRVLVTGPSGTGKTVLIEAMARMAERPLIRVEPSACLGGSLGASEQKWLGTLENITYQRRCLVLLEDVGNFFRAEWTTPDMQGVIQRMLSTLSRWLDQLPPGVLVGFTSASAPSLPLEIRKKMDWILDLSYPTDRAHRQAVFKAVLNRHNLTKAARNPELLEELAHLAGAASRRTPHSVLVSQADIAAWVGSALQGMRQGEDPDDPGFWSKRLPAA